AIDCYRRSIAVGPAAPAYVAWALVVAKLAGRAQKDLSRNQVSRRLFELGMLADPAHGPLYNAYG
ncbi:unnamed protein product, partial [Hapterophycus canaliculatus]